MRKIILFLVAKKNYFLVLFLILIAYFLTLKLKSEAVKKDSILYKNNIENVNIVKYKRYNFYEIYKIENNKRIVEVDPHLPQAFLGFVLLLIFYILDNKIKKQEKDTHQIFLTISIIGSLLIFSSVANSWVYKFCYAHIFGVLSIIVAIYSWHKDSWGIFFVNLLFIFLFLESIYLLV